jgi:hypothetical protein
LENLLASLFSTLLSQILPADLASAILNRPRKRRFGWYPTNLRMAILSMQVIAEPKIGHTIEKHFVEHDEEEDEDSGDNIDPRAHFHRQTKKIQRGIFVDRLTTRLPRKT